MMGRSVFIMGVLSMNDEIKSAREIAMEKIAALDTVTEDDKLKWKFVPEGEQMALKYFKDGQDITSALLSYANDAQVYVRKGAEEVFLSNIQLPANEALQSRNKKAIDGFLLIKKDRAAVTKVTNQIKQILGHYTEQGAEQRKQAYDSLKRQFEAKLKQAVSKQTGIKGDNGLGISVETLPQFKEELRRVTVQMDGQYIKLLDEHKKELRNLK
jgi:hypothetical protein